MPLQLASLHGALLINKPAGISSFGVIERLQKALSTRYGVKKRDLPKMGHGGTLDPFATGLLIVCVGRGVKLARYFLGSAKEYEGVIRFGETTVPGDPTSPVSETSSVIPASREEIQRMATQLTLQPYLQTPPMHSAKKKDGKPLYELAREGIEIEREAKSCDLYSFEIPDYAPPRASFRVTCSSGTYIRTLSQDLGRLLGTVAMLDSLHRSGSGAFGADRMLGLEAIESETAAGKSWGDLPCWIPFDQMLDSYDRCEASTDEAQALFRGQQNVLFNLLKRVTPATSQDRFGGRNSAMKDTVVIFHADHLIAIANRSAGQWGLERVFLPDEPLEG